jgi:hypothetical protein
MIWASVNLLFLIRTSSFAFPRKFYFQNHLVCGGITLPAKAERSAKLAQLRDLEAQMAVVGVLDGPRWRGRKPKTA